MSTDLRSTSPGQSGLLFHQVTSVVNGDVHAVTDVEMAAGIEAGTGTYRTLCDDLVVTDAMTAPPGRTCPACAAILRERAPRAHTADHARRGQHRRAGALAGWWRRVHEHPVIPAPRTATVQHPQGDDRPTATVNASVGSAFTVTPQRAAGPGRTPRSSVSPGSAASHPARVGGVL